MNISSISSILQNHDLCPHLRPLSIYLAHPSLKFIVLIPLTCSPTHHLLAMKKQGSLFCFVLFVMLRSPKPQATKAFALWYLWKSSQRVE